VLPVPFIKSKGVLTWVVGIKTPDPILLPGWFFSIHKLEKKSSLSPLMSFQKVLVLSVTDEFQLLAYTRLYRGVTARRRHEVDFHTRYPKDDAKRSGLHSKVLGLFLGIRGAEEQTDAVVKCFQVKLASPVRVQEDRDIGVDPEDSSGS
jgi:hypothetical protein